MCKYHLARFGTKRDVDWRLILRGTHTGTRFASSALWHVNGPDIRYSRMP